MSCRLTWVVRRPATCSCATLKLGDAVLPLGAADMSVYDAGIELPSSQVTAVTGNKATVYAAPDSRVELEVGGKRFAGTCNKLGRASIDYDVPDNLVPGQRVMLQAYLSGAQQPAATAYVTYTGGASIERFDVVTRGETQRTRSATRCTTSAPRRMPTGRSPSRLMRMAPSSTTSSTCTWIVSTAAR